MKTRTNNRFGKPSEAVNKTKQKRMHKTAKYFLYKEKMLEEFIRFDVIEIVMIKGKVNINHIKQIM